MRLSARAHLWMLMGLAFTALTVIIVLVMALRLFEARSRAFGDAEIYASALSKNLEYFHKNLVLEAQNLGGSAQVQSLFNTVDSQVGQLSASTHCKEWLYELIAGRPEFTNLLIYNAKGDVICSAKPNLDSKPFKIPQNPFLVLKASLIPELTPSGTTPSFIQKSLNETSQAGGTERTKTDSASMLYALGAPIVNLNGHLQGAIVFETLASARESSLSGPLSAHGGLFYLIDSRGLVISSSTATTHSPPFKVGDLIDSSLKESLSHHHEQSFSFLLSDGFYAAGSYMPTSGWSVITALPSDIIYSPLRNAIYWQTALLVIFGIFAFFMTRRISSRISNAALTLTEAAAHPERISSFKLTGVLEIDRSLSQIQSSHYANEQAVFERGLWQSASQRSLSGLAILRFHKPDILQANDDSAREGVDLKSLPYDPSCIEIVISNTAFERLIFGEIHDQKIHSFQDLPSHCALNQPHLLSELMMKLWHHQAYQHDVETVDIRGNKRHLLMSLHPLFEANTLSAQAPLAHLFSDNTAFAKQIAKVVQLEVENRQPHHLFSLTLDDLTELFVRDDVIQTHRITDALTGLPNRVLFGDRLTEALETAASTKTKAAVAFFDLSRFKIINDTLGHQAGDEIIAETAKRLKEQMKPGDTLSRLGGDEFGILLTHVSASCEEVAPFLDALAHTLKKPFFCKGQEISMDCSIGVAVYPDDALVPSHLLQRADIALLRAKESARPGAQFFSHDLGVAVEERLHMEIALKGAFRRGEIKIHYQPKIDLSTGVVVGMEALARWNHPTLGFVSPAKFIPVAEESDLITLLGREALHIALKDCKLLFDHGFQSLSVAVNISSRQIRPGFLEEIELALKHSGLPPHLLQAELTESLILPNSDVAADFLKGLTNLGIQVALDDFGTGWSNLSMLKKLSLSYLKMDRSFVEGLGQDDESEAIATAIISLAHALELKVIAEGVETPLQVERLQWLGAEQAQGYYVQPALPIDEMLDWLQSGSPLAFRSPPS